MAKKINTKVSGILPSALTVANPANYKSTTVPAQTGKASPSVGETPKSRLHKSKGKPVKLEGKPATSLPVKKSPGKVISLGGSEVRAVRLALFEPDAKQVSVCGAFNGWSTAALTRQADGEWETTLHLAPGRYEYKFLVDGQWAPDPRARENVMNEFGTLNSVVEVKA